MDENLKLRLLLAAGILLATILLRRAFTTKRDTREPPSVPASFPIPFFGHAIGLLWERTAYYANLR